MIRVKAIHPGVYLHRREPGDVFVIPSEKEKGSWMEVLEEPKKKTQKAPAKPAKPVETDDELGI